MPVQTAAYMEYVADPMRRRQFRPASVLTYRRALTRWADWLGAMTATPQTAQMYLLELVRAEKSRAYVNREAVILQSYLRWAIRDPSILQGFPGGRITLEYPQGFISKPPEMYYTPEQVHRFIETLSGAPRAVARVQYATACRLSEILNLRLRYKLPRMNVWLSDIHLDNNPPYIEVRLKGGRTDSSNLTQGAAEALRLWLDQAAAARARIAGPAHDMVFLDWNYSAIYGAYREGARTAGLPTGRSHILRHSRAVQLLREGVPIAQLSQMLHHRSVDTTAKIYTPLAPVHLQEYMKEEW